MAQISKWQKIGEPIILAENHGRSLVDQSFIHPKGQTIEYTIFCSKIVSVIIFPLTTDMSVVSVKQFRPGVGEIVTELPGGNADPEDLNLAFSAERELTEETGFVPKKIVQLIPESRLWIDPVACTPYVYPFLAIDCEKLKSPNNDKNEDIETSIVPLATWMEMITSGKIIDMKSIAITFLADMFLKRRHNDGYQTK